jgi:hypothetical protein
MLRGTLHHVMIRGIERSPIFKDDQDRQDFVLRTGRVAKETGTKILALRMGVRTRKYSRVRAEISYYLSHEFGVSGAEIARQLGVCTSAIAKAIQNMEGAGNKC